MRKERTRTDIKIKKNPKRQEKDESRFDRETWMLGMRIQKYINTYN